MQREPRIPVLSSAIIGATMEVYRIALGESTWGLRGSNTKDWSIQRTICANLRHLRLIFSRKKSPMSDLILCAKASTAKQPNSDRFSGTLPARSHHRLTVFSGISTWPHNSRFPGPKVSSETSAIVPLAFKSVSPPILPGTRPSATAREGRVSECLPGDGGHLWRGDGHRRAGWPALPR